MLAGKSGLWLSCFQAACVIPPDCAPDCINKGWLNVGPSVYRGKATEACCILPPTYLILSAEPYLRDCRMAFMKHVLPKFRRPVAPKAAPSWQRQVTCINMYVYKRLDTLSYGKTLVQTFDWYLYIFKYILKMSLAEVRLKGKF